MKFSSKTIWSPSKQLWFVICRSEISRKRLNSSTSIAFPLRTPGRAAWEWSNTGNQYPRVIQRCLRVRPEQTRLVVEITHIFQNRYILAWGRSRPWELCSNFPSYQWCNTTEEKIPFGGQITLDNTPPQNTFFWLELNKFVVNEKTSSNRVCTIESRIESSKEKILQYAGSLYIRTSNDW